MKGNKIQKNIWKKLRAKENESSNYSEKLHNSNNFILLQQYSDYFELFLSEEEEIYGLNIKVVQRCLQYFVLSSLSISRSRFVFVYSRLFTHAISVQLHSIIVHLHASFAHASRWNAKTARVIRLPLRSIVTLPIRARILCSDEYRSERKKANRRTWISFDQI